MTGITSNDEPPLSLTVKVSCVGDILESSFGKSHSY